MDWWKAGQVATATIAVVVAWLASRWDERRDETTAGDGATPRGDKRDAI